MSEAPPTVSPDPNAKQSRSSSWLRFFESASGPVLITVLVGGIFGTIITTLVQQAAARREQIRLEEKHVGRARLETVTRAFSLIGAIMGATEDLIVSRGPEYDLARYSGEELSRVTAQLHEIRVRYNTTDREWRSSRYSYALLLAYYHPGQAGAPARWNELSESVSAYVACARRWVVQPEPVLVYDGECKRQQEKVSESILAVADAVDVSRRTRS